MELNPGRNTLAMIFFPFVESGECGKAYCVSALVSMVNDLPNLHGVKIKKQARKLQATLDSCNPKLRPPTDLLTAMKCRATSVAKNYLDGDDLLPFC